LVSLLFLAFSDFSLFYDAIPFPATSQTITFKDLIIMNIYVGNLSFQTDNYDLEDLFAPHGEVVSARVITDRETGRARGFGFVEMASAEDGAKAVAALHEQEFMGRNLNINEALPREEKRNSYSRN